VETTNLKKSLDRKTTGRSAPICSSKNLCDARSSNYFAQPHKLIYAVFWLHVTPTFKIVHRRSADRAQNHPALIKHRELNDHPIDVVALHVASLQRHCKFSTLEEFHCATLIARSQHGMEPCGGAHHLSRRLMLFGYDARLMSAKYVRPYRCKGPPLTDGYFVDASKYNGATRNQRLTRESMQRLCGTSTLF